MTDPTRRRFIQGLGATGVVFHATLPALLAACKDKPGDTGEREVFYFAVITDSHVQASADHPNNRVLAETIAILNDFEVPLELVLLTGDLLDVLPSDDPAYYDEHDDTAIDQLRDLLAGLDIPWHAVLGNHDYFLDDGLGSTLTPDPAGREALLLDRLGLPGPWFRFGHEGIAFYGLSSMQRDARVDWAPDSCGSFGEEQLAWLEEGLADGKPAVFFTHHPLALDNAVSTALIAYRPFEVPRDEAHYDKYAGTEYEGWTDPIYAILEDRADQVLAVFVGHTHWFVRDEYAGVPVLMGDSIGNSVQDTSRGEGEAAVPMRYHIVEIDLTHGTMTVWNSDWITYNA